MNIEATEVCAIRRSAFE